MTQLLPNQPQIKPLASGEQVLGIDVSNLQDNIVISGNEISGTLKYVNSFPGFSDIPSEQSGNYLALYFPQNVEGRNVKVKITKEVPLDGDGKFIGLIKNNQQTITVTLDDNEPVVYKLDKLTIQPKGDD